MGRGGIERQFQERLLVFSGQDNLPPDLLTLVYEAHCGRRGDGLYRACYLSGQGSRNAAQDRVDDGRWRRRLELRRAAEGGTMEITET